MIRRTIERLRSASAWLRDPARLIDRLLDALEKLSVILVVPTRGGRAGGEAPIEARLD